MQGTRIDVASSELVFYERLVFCVLAVFVWIFIVRNLYTAYWTRQALMEEVAALPRVPDLSSSAAVPVVALSKGDKQH